MNTPGTDGGSHKDRRKPSKQSGDKPPSKAMASDRSTFTRRMDPSGKQALFSTPVVAASDQLGSGSQKEGRDALFSTGPRQVGTAIVECSSCLARVRCTLFDITVRLISVSAWLPARRHGHWMRCPACNQRTWCSIAWND